MNNIFDGKKKLIAALVASLLSAFGVYNGWETQAILLVISPIMTYILGQGIADMGKEQARLKQNNKE